MKDAAMWSRAALCDPDRLVLTIINRERPQVWMDRWMKGEGGVKITEDKDKPHSHITKMQGCLNGEKWDAEGGKNNNIKRWKISEGHFDLLDQICVYSLKRT